MKQNWPPPAFIKDPISGEFSIYYKREIRPSDKDECKNLERAAVWEYAHIVDRIMGETK